VLKEAGIKEVYPASSQSSGFSRVEESPRSSFSLPEPDKKKGMSLFPPPAAGGAEEAGRRVLGQYLNTYIVAVSPEGLLVIDQHNAHERVLFEKYREVDAQKAWPERVPLIPILFDLSPAEELSLEDNREILESAGFRVEAMGGRTYSLHAFPDILEGEEAREVLFALLEEMNKEEVTRRREKLLATLACKTAVKAGEALSREKMDYLVEELFKSANPSLCPHGRPVLIKLEKSQIEKGLKRQP